MKHSCRHCGHSLSHELIDLGQQPPSNAYLGKDDRLKPEKTYPLKVYVCNNCWLVQLPAHAAAQELFTADYAYFSSTSTSWCAHAGRFVTTAIDRLGLNEASLVVEVASNDGYLLQHVKRHNIPCLGIEPTSATAAVARERGIETIERFFDIGFAEELANEGKQADLIVANNVLAHVPDINDFLVAIRLLLKPQGVASLEFAHLLRLLEGSQFDTIYHEHYSYLSLISLQAITSRAGLTVVDVEPLPTHGGSLRLWLARPEWPGDVQEENIQATLHAERQAALDRLDGYVGFQQCAEAIKQALREFLLHQRRSGQRVLGYGAAAKGNTLLNYAGIRADLLEAVADRAPSKVGTFLPGSLIPVVSFEQFVAMEPDSVLVLPWNLATEIKEQLRILPRANLYRAIPKFALL